MYKNIRRFSVTRRLLPVLLLATTPILAGASDQASNFESRVVAAHNREREAIGVKPLHWNPALAADAAKWAEHLVKVGHLVHYQEAPDDMDPQGENLWAGTKGYYGLESMVGLWIDEKKDYKPGVFPANSRTGELEDVGHYTQLIWRTTHQVGCAVARGARDDFLVCRYAEGGNVIGERPI
jgi:hypothetical protein